MAREHGRIYTSIWSDEDFRRLTVGAQHMYLMLATSPTLSYCGVADWRPARLRPLARDWDKAAFRAAVVELVQRLYVVVDEDTEEVLVRSFIRNDGLMKQRHMGVSMAKAHSAVSSNALRGVIVHELIRLREDQPELKGWGSEAVLRILGQTPIDPSGYPLGDGMDKGEVHPPVHSESHPLAQPPFHTESHPSIHPTGQPPSTPSPSPTPSPTPKGGYVSTEGNQGAEQEPPSPKCPKHINNPDPPNCRACGDARKARAEWDSLQALERLSAKSAEAQRRAEIRAQAINDCDLCDEDGYRDALPCDHDPESEERAKRGMALVRETLANRGVA